MRTDLDADAARSLLAQLEETRAAMLAVWWRQPEGPPVRISVIALRNQDEIHDVVGRRIAGMWVQHSPFPGTMLISGDDSKEGLRILSHELAHSLSRWFVPLQPRWYAEGLACVLESVRYDRAHGEAVVAQDVRVRYHDLLRSRLLTTQQMLADNQAIDDRALGRFESSSWLLVQYLLQSRPTDFAQLEARLNRLESPSAAWAAVFGSLPLAQLDDDLYRFAARHEFRSLGLPLALPIPLMNARKLTDAEVHGTLAFVFGVFTPSDQAGAQNRARHEIDEALRHDPNLLQALALRFYARSAGDEQQRDVVAGRALKAHPEAWLAQVMTADAAGVDEATAAAVIDQALLLAPDEPEVLMRVTIARLAQARWAEALTASTRAIQLGAASQALFVAHTVALARTGNCQGAAVYLQSLPRLLSPPEAARLARQWPMMRGPNCPRVEMR